MIDVGVHINPNKLMNVTNVKVNPRLIFITATDSSKKKINKNLSNKTGLFKNHMPC